MARVPYVKRDELDAGGQEIYDRIGGDRGRSEVGLQYQAMLHNPKATGYLASLVAQSKTENAVPEHLKELAIILVAREWNSDIEWTGHAPLAIHAGISAASVEAIRTRKAPAGLTEEEQIIARFVHQLLRQKEVSDDAFTAAQELLGTRGVVDLTFTCISFTALSMGQIALKPEIRAGKTSTL